MDMQVWLHVIATIIYMSYPGSLVNCEGGCGNTITRIKSVTPTFDVPKSLKLLVHI